MRLKRLTAMLTALVMAALLLTPCTLAESFEDVVVVSAPLRRSASVLDGMVRVWLQSIGSVTHLDVTITGNYSAATGNMLSFSTGDEIDIDFSKTTGAITMTFDGVSYDMGTEMRLRRHQADGESAVSIAQASKPSYYYPGDLQLKAVQLDDGTYQLYPIVHVYLEYYLYGVVPNEMGSSFPLEALKAQSVAARTYALARMNANESKKYDLGDTSAYQVYKGYSGNSSRSTQAVDETKGIVIMNDGSLTGTYYTASNGGQTEAAKNAWGSVGYDYLGVKDDPFDAANTSSIRRRLTVYSDFDHESQNATLAQILTEAAQVSLGDGAVIQTIDSITPHTPKYAVPSRLYTMMDFGVTALVDGVETEATLSFSIFDDLEIQLSMSINGKPNKPVKNEVWSVEKLDDDFRMVVGRWGHGIGMSQRGAQKMAQMNYTYDQILGFYYDGCERVQYTFTHTILPAGGTSDIISSEAAATITPADTSLGSVLLPGVSDVLPLRYTAEEDGTILTGIPNGSVVTVLSTGDEWSLVSYGDISGYIPTEYLSFSGTPSSSGTESATEIVCWATVTGTNRLNFRSSPDKSDSTNVITELSEGTVLCVLEKGDEWAKVQWGTQSGYVAVAYLEYHDAYPGETSGDASAMVSLSSESATASLLSSPSTSAATLMSIPHGTQVTVLTNDGSWCRVRVAGVEGYLLTRQLDFDATGVTPTEIPGLSGMTAIVNPNASTLNLREGPNTDSDIKTTIPKGTTIIVTSYGDTWCAVQWGELTGYVMTKYLLFEEEETPTPTPSDSESETPDDSETPTPTPDASSGTTAWVVGTVSYVNLRETASNDGKIITRIPSGDELTVQEEGSTFSYVEHGVGSGYVLTKYLTYSQPLHAIGVVYINTNVDPLALRDAPTLSGSTVKTRIPKGTAVMLIEELGDWCYVQYGDYIGYCSSAYLSRSKPTEYETDDTPIYDPSMSAVSGWTASVSTADGSALPAYKWCSTGATKMTSVPDGSVVQLAAKGDIWSKITYEGVTGYCLSSKLIFIPPTE